MQNFKQKKIKVGQKIPYCGIFMLKLGKTCHIWNQFSQFFQNAEIFAKIKILKFGTKMLGFGNFGLKFRNYCYISNQLPQSLKVWGTKITNLGVVRP